MSKEKRDEIEDLVTNEGTVDFDEVLRPSMRYISGYWNVIILVAQGRLVSLPGGKLTTPKYKRTHRL